MNHQICIHEGGGNMYRILRMGDSQDGLKSWKNWNKFSSYFGARDIVLLNDDQLSSSLPMVKVIETESCG